MGLKTESEEAAESYEFTGVFGSSGKNSANVEGLEYNTTVAAACLGPKGFFEF